MEALSVSQCLLNTILLWLVFIVPLPTYTWDGQFELTWMTDIPLDGLLAYPWSVLVTVVKLVLSGSNEAAEMAAVDGPLLYRGTGPRQLYKHCSCSRSCLGSCCQIFKSLKLFHFSTDRNYTSATDWRQYSRFSYRVGFSSLSPN